jgi:hypothetical protein
MAEKQASSHENSRTASADANGKASGGIVGLLFKPFEVIGTMIGKVGQAIFRDGTLEAAGRQGVDELALALKPFPESIQTSEMGTLWNPTPGEIAADREHGRHSATSGGSPHPWPSEIANQNRHLPSKDHGNGHENGHDAGDGHSM